MTLAEVRLKSAGTFDSAGITNCVSCSSLDQGYERGFIAVTKITHDVILFSTCRPYEVWAYAMLAAAGATYSPLGT